MKHIIEYLDNKGIEHKEDGDEVKLQYCPYCEFDDGNDFVHFAFSNTKENNPFNFNLVKLLETYLAL